LSGMAYKTTCAFFCYKWANRKCFLRQEEPSDFT